MPEANETVAESLEGHPEVVRSLEEIRQKGKDAEAQLLAVSGSFAAITAASLGLSGAGALVAGLGSAVVKWLPQILNFFGVVGGAAAARPGAGGGRDTGGAPQPHRDPVGSGSGLPPASLRGKWRVPGGGRFTTKTALLGLPGTRSCGFLWEGTISRKERKAIQYVLPPYCDA